MGSDSFSPVHIHSIYIYIETEVINYFLWAGIIYLAIYRWRSLLFSSRRIKTGSAICLRFYLMHLDPFALFAPRDPRLLKRVPRPFEYLETHGSRTRGIRSSSIAGAGLQGIERDGQFNNIRRHSQTNKLTVTLDG